ncbi:hypothetical protein R6Z07F_004234 [Ovis aries]
MPPCPASHLPHTVGSRSRTLFQTDDPADVGNLISASTAFSKSSLSIWKFMVHGLLKPDLENFKHVLLLRHFPGEAAAAVAPGRDQDHRLNGVATFPLGLSGRVGK